MSFKAIGIFFFLSIFTLSCGQQKPEIKQHSESVKSDSPKQHGFDAKINDLKTSMITYMEMSNPSYTIIDVDECIKILKSHVDQISKTKSKSEGMELVKSTVIKLNKLNEKSEYQLIETGEREIICDIIIRAGQEKGYNKLDEDITEEFREW